MITLEEVKRIVAALPDSDPEGAHYDEDQMYAEVLRAVAAEEPDARAMAVEALRSQDMNLTRWYA